MITEVSLKPCAVVSDAARIPGSLDLRLSLQTAGDMGPSGSASRHRDDWLRRVGVDPGQTALRRQTHSRDVVEVDSVNALRYEQAADGTVTADQRLSLAVTVADCMPIFLFDKEHGVRALLHSGWKGTGIVNAAIDIMAQRWASRAAALQVVLGPCIGACCYRVDAERARIFAGLWGTESVRTDDRGAQFIDLRAANIGILHDRGVEQITVATDCTVCSSALGSYRRQGAAGFTRMLALFVGRRTEG